MLKFRFVGIIT